jgi:FkbM family methyltransferase
MDLRVNQAAPLTRWLVDMRALAEPFVLIDVGVYGGEQIRWHALGNNLMVHGFDPIEEEIARLRQSAGSPRRHYHQMAIGAEDTECDFYVNAANPTSSMLCDPGEDRLYQYAERKYHVRRVPMRRLDSLLEDGTIVPADFLKMDVEGFERGILEGADRLLGSGILGVETETNFNCSPVYPKGHLPTLHELLLPHGFTVHDVAFDRIPRASYQQALVDRGRPALPADQAICGRTATYNVLFMRNLIAEADNGHMPTVDKILKSMMAHEGYGLSDIAVDMAFRFEDVLNRRIDVKRAIDLLVA